MKNIELLTRVGLSHYASQIYLTLIERGPETISDISKHTGLHRPTISAHIPDLEEKGLLTTSKKGKRTLYVAESPDHLIPLFEQTKHELQKYIPELSETFSKRAHKPIVTFYEGKQGIRRVFDDLLNTLKRGDTFYRYSSRKEPTDDTYLPSDYRQRRDEKKLERFVIANDTYVKTKKTRIERQIKVIPKSFGLFEYDVTTMIYKDKLAIIDYSSETAFIVDNPALAHFQQTLFRLLYYKL